MTDLAVANTILEQMGGARRLALMIGAKNFVGGKNDLMFAFSGSTKANKCRITLDRGSDTYKFELLKVNYRTFDHKVVYELEGVYWDMLKKLFEEETGLYLRLV
jgi:hypothetical protein